MDATLEPRLIISDELAGDFFIPAYQRGYRWGEHEVTQLLKDIDQAVIRPDSPADYYLQPIVALRRDEASWEIVDGQQRLTTLYLIVKFIRTELPTAKLNYSLSYETREQSREYLEDLDPERRKENIDFHHIFCAYEAIRTWFANQKDPQQAAIDMRTALAKRVWVIWYEAERGSDATALFTRLNVGRIPLTDSELIKALVLSRSGARDGHPDRREQLAAEWNSIERDLRDPELWAFLTAGKRDLPTHIDFLFELLAGARDSEREVPFWVFEQLRKQYFEGASDHSTPRPERSHDEWLDPALRFWRRVVAMHGQIVGWFEDRELYHRIGFLVACGDSLADILELTRGLTRPEISGALVARITARLSRTRSAVGDLTYSDDLAECGEALLLMNVETVLSHHAADRFSFHAFASSDWSVEHIHAQNAAALNRAEQWSTWLMLHRQALAAMPRRTAEADADLLRRIDEAIPTIDAGRFRALEPEIVAAFASSDEGVVGDEVHRLPNLALLDRSTNSALGNSVFEVKRQEILRRDQAGAFIPPCTRNVFLKYYTSSADQQLHVWGPQDRRQYYDKMLRLLKPFLLPDPLEVDA